MSEKNQRRRVVTALKSLDAVSVENSVYPGTPDVNHNYGWIELKHLPNWPRRPESEVKVEHFTPQQRAWISRRVRHGGVVHVLLQVGREWLLFNGQTAAMFLGRLPRGQLENLAIKHWPKGLNEKELIKCLGSESRAILDL